MTVMGWVAVVGLSGAAAVAIARGILTANGRPIREKEADVDRFGQDYEEGLRIVGAPFDGMDVGMDIETEGERERLHGRNVAHLHAYVQARAAHLVAVPDCDAAPLCGGPAASIAIVVRDQMQPGYIAGLLGSAIAELAGRDAEIADLKVRLMGMDADLVDAHGRLADAEDRLDVALARLAARDELLGDARPPVAPVDES